MRKIEDIIKSKGFISAVTLTSVILVITIVLFVHGYSASKSFKETQIENAQTVFNFVSAIFDEVIIRAEQDLQVWSDEIEIGDYPSACEAPYTSHLKNKSLMLNYGLVDIDGEPICLYREVPEEFNFNDLTEYRQLVADQVFTITNFGYSESTGLPRIGFGYPLFNDEGKFNGAIFLSESLEILNDEIATLELPQDSEILITDIYGAIEVIYPENNELIGEQKFSSTTFSLILSQQSGSMILKEEDNTKRIYIYEPYSYSDTNLVTSFIIYSVPYDQFLFF